MAVTTSEDAEVNLSGDKVCVPLRPWSGLTPEDRALLAPRFEKLSRDAASVAALSRDLVSEMQTAA